MYDTFGQDVLEYVMGQSEIEAIFVAEKNCKALGKLVQSMQSRAHQIRGICIWSDYSNTSQTDILAAKQVTPLPLPSPKTPNRALTRFSKLLESMSRRGETLSNAASHLMLHPSTASLHQTVQKIQLC